MKTVSTPNFQGDFSLCTKLLSISLVVVGIFSLNTSCQIEDAGPKNPPSLTTIAISNISSDSASSGGFVSSDGGETITDRGIVWSTDTSPIVSLSTKTKDGSGTGSFTSNLTGLLARTKYYVRAYATNSQGTAYGDEVTFTTNANLPSITPSTITSITASSAVGGGNISSDGGAPITVRGSVWSTSSGPTVSFLSKTADGSGTGSFTSNLTGLASATKYYVRAYATNSSGVAYGTEMTFTTQSLPTVFGQGVTDIESNFYKTVIIGSQEWMAENLKTSKYNDGSSIPNITGSAEWNTLSTPAYCWLVNDEINYKEKYGAYTTSTL